MPTKKTVMVFGVFDQLHPGHLFFLESAKKFGDHLIVVITRDTRVKSEKGRAAMFNEKERLRMVSALACVDHAILGDTGKTWGVVRRLKPAIICRGHDQTLGHPQFMAQQKTLKKPLKLVKIKPFHRDRYSSSRLRTSR